MWIGSRLSRALKTALTLVAVVGFATSALAQVNRTLSQKSRDANEIASIAAKQGHVRVIVEFAPVAAAAAMRPDAAVLARVKQQIRAQQDAIITRHFGNATAPREGRGFQRGLVRMDISPMFAVNVSLTELNSLAADTRVLRIHYDRPQPPSLIQSVPLIGMTGAYAVGATGTNQAVAIIDTGVQSNHEFLTGKVVLEACFSNSGGGGGKQTLCPNGTATQTGAGAANANTAQCLNGSNHLCYHGTHVAGIAAGFNTNQQGGEPPNGVSKNSKVVAVQVFTRFNSAADCGGAAPCVLSFTSDMVSALNWIYQNAINLPNGVKTAAANMSIGGGVFTGNCDSDPRKLPIDNLRAAGVATVIAAGNDGFVNAVGAPGCISSAVTVASSTKADAISSFSNMSAVVDLFAPGSSILSSIPDGSNLSSTTTYAFLDGTSMATPHVTGAFAAIRSAPGCSTKTVDQIEAALKSTGLGIPDNRGGGTQTKPRIRVDQALTSLNCGTSPAPIVVTTAANPVGSSTATLNGSVNPNGSAATGFFQWGTTTSYGNTTSTQTLGSGSSAVALAAGLTGLSPSTTYHFRVVGSNTAGTVFGNDLTFTTTSACNPPSNDNFANAAATGNGTVTGTNLCATKETGEPAHAGFVGGRSVWWRFTAAASGQTTVNTCGSNFDTLLAVYTGSVVNALVGVAANDDASAGPCPGTQSYLTFNAVAGTTYFIAVDGFGGLSGSIQLTLAAPTAQPPIVVTDPASLIGSTSATLNGSVNPNGLAATGSFQWGTTTSYGNTTTAQSMGGGTAAVSLSAALTGLNPSTTYHFQALGNNSAGTSAGIDRTFTTTSLCTPPGNDNFASAAAIGIQTLLGNNVCATKEAGEPDHAGSTGGKSVWWQYTASTSGQTTVHTCNSGFDTLLALYTGSAVNALAEIASDDDATAGPCQGTNQSYLTFSAVAGSTYFIAVDGFHGASGTVELTIVGPGNLQAPVIIRQPKNLRLFRGQTAHFSANATGSPNPKVQWQVSKDGGSKYTNIHGATSKTLRFTAQKTMNEFRYRAVFRNSAGSATTRPAVLRIKPTIL